MAVNSKFWSLLFLLFSGFLLPSSDAAIGINYGQIADNLLPPEKVVGLLKSIGVNKVKLYDADPRVLAAFANTGVEFIVGLGNEYIQTMRDPAKALTWVRYSIQAYLPATKITCIVIGNEVLTGNDTDLMDSLLSVMQSIHTALQTLGLDKQISVTTPHSLAILENSYPPSQGGFRRDLSEFLPGILNFLSKTGSPFLINAYPFFAYKADPNQIPLDYVLFESSQGPIDPFTKLHYDNMLFAQIDAVHSALAAEGYDNLPVQISETGWPSKGDADEVGANLENAMKYNGNLLELISNKRGTPLKPSLELDVYVFALFNENLKPGPTSERNYGLFKPDGTPAYKIAFGGNNQDSGIPTNTGKGNATAPNGSPSPDSSSPSPDSSLPPPSSSSPSPDSSSPSPDSLSPSLAWTFSSAKLRFLELRLGGVCYLLCLYLVWFLALV